MHRGTTPLVPITAAVMHDDDHALRALRLAGGARP
jgi:hypothetical protein